MRDTRSDQTFMTSRTPEEAILVINDRLHLHLFLLLYFCHCYGSNDGDVGKHQGAAHGLTDTVEVGSLHTP